MTRRCLLLPAIILFLHAIRGIKAVAVCNPDISEFSSGILQEINAKRAAQGNDAKPLKEAEATDQTMTKGAIEDVIKSVGVTGTTIPKDHTGMGQSVFIKTEAGAPTVKDIVETWYKEQDEYKKDPTKPNFEKFKNFASMVWKESEFVRCSVCTDDGTPTPEIPAYVAICRYKPGKSDDEVTDANILENVGVGDKPPTLTSTSTARPKTDSLHENTRVILAVASVLLTLSALTTCILGVFVGFMI